MINGNEYAFEDIQVVMLGRPVVGCTGITYKVSREKKNIKARGSSPVARARGQKEYEATITLLQSEVEALQRTLRQGDDLTDIPPFEIVVAYAPRGGVITTDVLETVEFVEYEKGMKVDDTNMEVELTLMVGSIKYNV